MLKIPDSSALVQIIQMLNHDAEPDILPKLFERFAYGQGALPFRSHFGGQKHKHCRPSGHI
ncbi:hypothetical protein D3C81_1868510 [compost metagenome]